MTNKKVIYKNTRNLKHATCNVKHVTCSMMHKACSLLLVALSLTIFLSSCKKQVNEKELINYIKNPDNGILIEKEIGTVNYKVYYKPSDLLVNQEVTAYEIKTDSLIKLYQDIYAKNLYFMVSISQNNQEVLNNLAGNKQRFGSMVNQLAFGMDQKVTLTTSEKDTLYLKDYIYPRTYGVGNSTDMLFAFENKNINKAEWLQLLIEDFGLQTGDVRFKFLTKDIRKTPTLKFE